jgi:hypothetical protein
LLISLRELESLGLIKLKVKAKKKVSYMKVEGDIVSP